MLATIVLHERCHRRAVEVHRRRELRLMRGHRSQQNRHEHGSGDAPANLACKVEERRGGGNIFLTHATENGERERNEELRETKAAQEQREDERSELRLRRCYTRENPVRDSHYDKSERNVDACIDHASACESRGYR